MRTCDKIVSLTCGELPAPVVEGAYTFCRAFADGQVTIDTGVILSGLGLGKLATLEPKTVVMLYEPQLSGELIHIDSKKPGASSLVQCLSVVVTNPNRARGSPPP